MKRKIRDGQKIGKKKKGKKRVKRKREEVRDG